MNDDIEERIWDSTFGNVIYIDEQREGLMLTASDIQSESTGSVTLDLGGVQKLRRVLQRYERKCKREA